MRLQRPDLAALALLAVVVVCVTVLAVLEQGIPEILSTIGLVLVGTAGGAALPQPRAGDPAPKAPAPAPAPAPTPAPVLEQAPAAAVSATHAP